MNTVVVGDQVRVKRGTSRSSGRVVAAESDGRIRVEVASGNVYPYRQEHVVEIVKKAEPVVGAETKKNGVHADSMLGIGLAVLADHPKGLHVALLWDAIELRGFKTEGKTPKSTLAANLLTAQKKGLVTKVAPATFALVVS